MRHVLWLGSMLATAALNAQSIEITSVSINKNLIVLEYNLADTVEGRAYTIRLYGSADNYLTPLKEINGDAGLAVNPGPGKRIEWNAPKELKSSVNANIALELRARVYIPFINVDQINQYDEFKRGRNFDLIWSGGKPGNILNFELLRGDHVVHAFPNVGNNGHHSFRFPPHLRPKDNYRFRISDARNSDEVVYTESFRVKRKFPLLAKAAIILGIGYIAASQYEPEPEEIGNPFLPGKD